eukprot:9182964-Lingulodinium_polyedra.AAC.1
MAVHVASSCGGTAVVGKRGVAASTDRESMISAPAGASKEAKCLSPVPGPVGIVMAWRFLAQL